MVNVKIDGVDVQVEPNSTILEAAEKAGVHIPILCHDKVLKPFGACRVCLVEVKNNPKLMTACTTPVMDNMEITTKNDKLAKIRKTLIELLLINHPLDCPVCDKGGECTLQDLTYEFGVSQVRFDPKPNDTPVDHTNPFIERDIDRCVLCGRCVRICDEVVNIQAISFQNRGTDTIIGTSFNQPWNCEFCGQCMSVCPVGSLNNRVYLFKNRPWNLQKTESICGLCSCGCSILIDSEDNEVFRIKEDYDLGVNKGLLCVKGRFGFELINNVKREKNSKIKVGEEFKNISIEDAISTASKKLAEIKSKYGSDSIGVVVSSRLTNEEAFLARKLAKDVIGTPYIFSSETDDAMPEGTYADIENADDITVLNIDVTESNPVLGFFIRMTARKNEGGLRVFYPKMTALKRVASEFYTGKPSELLGLINDFADAVEGKSNRCSEAASKLLAANSPVLVFNPYSKADLAVVSRIKKAQPKVKLIPCKLKNNSQGIVDMGCVTGADLVDGLGRDKIKALVVLGENIAVNPGYVNLVGVLSKLEFILSTDPYFTETSAISDLYIPVATFAEKSGTFTNFEGRVQTVNPAIDKGLISDFDLLVSLINSLGGKAPDSVDAAQELIRKEISNYSGVDFNGGVVEYPYAVKDVNARYEIVGSGSYELYRCSLRFHSGTFTTWSPDLTKVYKEATIEINPEDAADLNLKDGDLVTVKAGETMKKFYVEIEKYNPRGVVSIPMNYKGTEAILAKGEYQRVELIKHA